MNPKTPQATRRFLRLQEAAARLGVAECRVRELIRLGRIPAVKLGTVPLIPVHGLEAELAQRRERRLREAETRHLTPGERERLRRRRALERALAEAERVVAERRKTLLAATEDLRAAEEEVARRRERLQRLL